MKNKLYIKTTGNWLDAWAQFGIVLSNEGQSALLTPAGLKDYIENNSALEHGKQVATGSVPKQGARDITLSLYLCASSTEQFYGRYNAFCTELAKGFISIKTSLFDNVIYHCTYVSCNQFTQFNGRMAKFSLRLCEPNPSNRS